MALKPTYANVELADGTIHTDVRVTYQDRVRYEVAAKARGWQGDKQPFTTAGFLAFVALTRTEKYDGSWDEFRAGVIDVQLSEDGAADPTSSPEPSAEPSPH